MFASRLVEALSCDRPLVRRESDEQSCSILRDERLEVVLVVVVGFVVVVVVIGDSAEEPCVFLSRDWREVVVSLRRRRRRLAGRCEFVARRIRAFHHLLELFVCLFILLL